ncbi:MAG TPA: transcriptional repressor [Candidatus Saccharimonadales bacterium]|nr:transcriptional repressor [Candidatus Saccharimonadales bacterium]
MDPSQKLQKLLLSRGLRLTQPRKLVLDFLVNAAEPVQIHQIVALSGNWADRASIYRTIKLFNHLGIIKTVHRPGGDWLELGEDFSPHHHHLVCSRCGYSQVIHSPNLEYQLAGVAEVAGFRPLEHHVEISGLCPDCLKLAGNQ